MDRPRTRRATIIPAALLLGLAGPSAQLASAQTREVATVDAATITFYEIMSIPEGGIPPALIEGAQAVAIIPGVLKAGFLAGIRYGEGILTIRRPDGGWSNPVFVTLAGGSFGFQAGAQATDLILVFKNRRSLEGFLQGRGKFTIGADAAAAAGPVGRQLEAATNLRLDSEILSYSRSRGLFAGVSLEGAGLSLDWRANVDYYGEVRGPSEILAGAPVRVPHSAARLKGWLAYYTSPPRPIVAEPPARVVVSQPAPRDESAARTADRRKDAWQPASPR